MTLLEEEGLHGLVHCHSFAWEPIPIDQNVLSLEVGRVHHFRDLFVDRNTASLWEYARAVVGVQSLYGQIPNRVAVGGLACAVLDQVKVMENASLYSSAVPSAPNKTSGAPGSGGSGRSEIGHVFLFDRALDLTPLLLSPLTYEALLDETFGVTCGFVEVLLHSRCLEPLLRRLQNLYLSPFPAGPEHRQVVQWGPGAAPHEQQGQALRQDPWEGDGAGHLHRPQLLRQDGAAAG